MAFDLTLPSDPSLKPGEARCPGPSTKDLILADVDRPSPGLLEERYEFLGDNDIPFDRYFSKHLFQLEMERMWSRVWQWACREEHIPNVGDYIVYDVGESSIIVTRTAKDSIKAFYNSCLHRGMQLCDAGSSGQGKQFFRCPFHGFSWNIDGRLREIPCRWDFPHIKDEDFSLPEARVARWGGFVFISMDPHAPALETYMEVMPEHFRNWRLEDRYVSLHTVKVLPANWKMAMEAFLEAYHVLATHPQGIRTAADANAQYDIFGKHVTRFIHTVGYPSPHLANPPNQQEILNMMTGSDTVQLKPGEIARTLVAENTRRRFQAQGVDLSKVSTSEILDSIEYFLFPNMFVFPGVSLPMIYRFRPNGMDVDTCIHEILFLTPKPANAPSPPPAKPYFLKIEDSFTQVPGFDPGLAEIFDQDTVNLQRQRDGAKAAKKRGQTLGNYQEARIRRLHMTLDDYVRAPITPASNGTSP